MFMTNINYVWKRAQNGEGLDLRTCNYCRSQVNLIKVNTVGRMLSEANLAYIAGLFDGDGAIMALIEKHSEKKFGFRVRVIVKITQKDPKVLYWVERTTKLGSVVKSRTTHEWILRNQTEILEFLKNIICYLKNKDNQAKIAIRILQFKIRTYKDLVNIGKLADALSNFNVRSKGRRRNFVARIQESIPRND